MNCTKFMTQICARTPAWRKIETWNWHVLPCVLLGTQNTSFISLLSLIVQFMVSLLLRFLVLCFSIVQKYHGNYDRDDVVTNILHSVLVTRCVRIVPLEAYGNYTSMRLELLGCGKNPFSLASYQFHHWIRVLVRNLLLGLFPNEVLQNRRTMMRSQSQTQNLSLFWNQQAQILRIGCQSIL